MVKKFVTFLVGAMILAGCTATKTVVSKISTPSINPQINLNIASSNGVTKEKETSASTPQYVEGKTYQVMVYGGMVPVKITKENELCKVMPKSLEGCTLVMRCVSGKSRLDNTIFGIERFKCGEGEVVLTSVKGEYATNLINQFRIAVAQRDSNVKAFTVQGFEAGKTSSSKGGTLGVILNEEPDEVLLLDYSNMDELRALSILKGINLKKLIITKK